uniref:Uncharacterized protein n=1 Tax=Panagrolaimus sp. JU765 TaxID=591449 RepID=A0AC34R551_9BILA
MSVEDKKNMEKQEEFELHDFGKVDNEKTTVDEIVRETVDEMVDKIVDEMVDETVDEKQKDKPKEVKKKKHETKVKKEDIKKKKSKGKLKIIKSPIEAEENEDKNINCETDGKNTCHTCDQKPKPDKRKTKCEIAKYFFKEFFGMVSIVKNL